MTRWRSRVRVPSCPLAKPYFVRVCWSFITVADIHKQGRNGLYHAEVTVSDIDNFGNDWLLAGRAESTFRTYRQILAQAPFPLPGTIRDAKNWLAIRRQEVSVSSLIVHVRALRAYARWWAEEYGESDPLVDLEFPKAPTPAPGHIIDDSVIEQLRATLGIFSDNGGRTPSRDRAILEVFVHTGMRRSEVVALDLDDVDLARKILTVKPSKNGHGRRVPIGQELHAALRRYIQSERRTHRHAAHNALFLGTQGRLRADSITQLFRRMSERAGLSEVVGTHEFRRRFVDQWVTRGGADDDLMQIAGWKSPAMPARYRAAHRGTRAIEQYHKLFDEITGPLKPIEERTPRHVIRRSPKIA